MYFSLLPGCWWWCCCCQCVLGDDGGGVSIGGGTMRCTSCHWMDGWMGSRPRLSHLTSHVVCVRMYNGPSFCLLRATGEWMDGWMDPILHVWRVCVSVCLSGFVSACLDVFVRCLSGYPSVCVWLDGWILYLSLPARLPTRPIGRSAV